MCTVYSKQCQILSRSRSLSRTLTLQGSSPQDVDTPSLSPVFLAVPSSASDSAAQLAQVAHPNSRTHSPVFVSDLDPESHRALGLLFRAPPVQNAGVRRKITQRIASAMCDSHLVCGS